MNKRNGGVKAGEGDTEEMENEDGRTQGGGAGKWGWG